MTYPDSTPQGAGAEGALQSRSARRAAAIAAGQVPAAGALHIPSLGGLPESGWAAGHPESALGAGRPD